jgi:hypothetical protein
MRHTFITLQRDVINVEGGSISTSQPEQVTSSCEGAEEYEADTETASCTETVVFMLIAILIVFASRMNIGWLQSLISIGLTFALMVCVYIIRQSKS